MDGDLWSWRYDQDAGESSHDEEYDWLADFYFDYKKDVIAEDAMNEKCCIHVLKILIKKADDDIDELEKDLLLLQCDLAWTDSKNKLEVCCNALREKINVLDCSIKSLRQSDEINREDKLPLDGQPAEKLCEVLKPLLEDVYQQDDGQSVGYFHGTSNVSTVKVKGEEMEENSSSPAADTMTLGSFPKHKESDVVPGKQVKPEMSSGRVGSHAFTTANTGLKLENLHKSVSKIEIEEAKEHHTSATEMSTKMNPSSKSILPKAHKQHRKSASEEVNADVSRKSDGCSKSKRSFDLDLSFLAQSNGDNIEEKLIELILRNKKKKCNKELIVPESRSASCLPSTTKGKVDNDLGVLKTEESSPLDDWDSPISLLSELQNQPEKDATRNQTKELDKLSLEDSQCAEDSSHDCNLHMNVDHKPKAGMEKGQRISHTSLPKAKRHRKPGIIGDYPCLDQPIKRKQLTAKMQDVALEADKNPDPPLLNKGTSDILASQELKDFSLITDISNSCQIKPDSGTAKDAPVVESCRCSPTDYSTETLVPLPSKTLKLEDLSLVDLRTLARQLKLTKYHKLRKRVLLELLVSQLRKLLN